MSVDRTREFLSLADGFGSGRGSALARGGDGRGNMPSTPGSTKAGHVGSSVLTTGAAAPPAFDNRTAFMRAISDVSSDLHSTSMKLGALTKLVKKRGMFGDSSIEIERLTGSIKTDMATLNSRLDSLQTYISTRKEEAAKGGAQPGRPLPSPPTAAGSAAGPSAAAAGAGLSSSRSHAAIGGVASGIAAPPADLLSCVQGIAHSDVVVAQLKGQLLGFTGSLKSILQTRTESIKAQVDRRQQFGGVRDLGRPLSSAAAAAAASRLTDSSSTSTSAGPDRPGMRGGASASVAGAGSNGSSASGRGSGSGDDAIVKFDGGGGRASAAASAFGVITQAQLLPENALLEARANDVAALEHHISDLSTMFSRLANVVMEQGSLVDRIEDNLDSSIHNMEAGTTQLTRYMESVSSNRALVMKIAAILVLFFILFALFA